ncbi:hypothetical protein [Paenibacillus graminis]|uniref:hypothetical protein n=1 Tax=Paenibacillus graminis TaxID=189425 RepID=UPI002DBE42D5|nr:hypothetical protein [Paenibacillus graminis]MEC0167414.1 hypothetical protein [Paenibacillus graminis]
MGESFSVRLIDDLPVIKSMVGERIWKLKEKDEARFWVELKQYVERGYAGYTVVGAEHPIIYLRDDRGTQYAKVE